MSDTAELLFELGTEELPAGPLASMAEALRQGILDGLASHGLNHGEATWYATPRRLAVRVQALTRVAPDVEVEMLGPPASAAKDADGNWTSAAEGFARKQGMSADDLNIIETDKGPRLGLKRTQPGAKAIEVAGEIIASAVAGIPVAKRMRWGRSRNEFLRPVQWLVALLDDAILPLNLFDLEAGRTTRGHRFHHPMDIELAHAKDYLQQMEAARVMVDFESRRSAIRAQVSAIAEADGAIAVISEDLLDEVTGLVEWPVALKGSFDPDFLRIPAQALISSMKEHQKYFHAVNSAGDLLPMFITVANIESSNPDLVARGNEKVIRPRLSDAAFFFETDKQSSLESRHARLAGVVFQQQLGTLADKTARIRRLAGMLSAELHADAAVTERAANLAKCDLVSELVLEFPELQGIAGAHYAANDGEPDGVVTAIEQHYWPKFAGDQLPETPEASAVALADRLDTLTGIFGIGQIPTGSKDPFGLRRAALAVIRILIQGGSSLDIASVAKQAYAGYSSGLLADNTPELVTEYIVDRLRSWYEDQGVSVDILRSVTATGITEPSEIDRRVHAVKGFAQTEAAIALAAANKRVANILAKSEETISGEPAAELMVAAEETALYRELLAVEDALKPLLAAKDYAAALAALATLRAPVDAFFDKVMVNAEDPKLRRNRYQLLASLREKFVRIADIAQLTASA